MTRIVKLIKFVNKIHIDSFVCEGQLFMNTLDYFRSYEEDDEDLRADRHEGLMASLLPSQVKITKEDGTPIKGIIGKIETRKDIGNYINVFCMTAITEYKNLDLFPLDPRFKKFGDTAVVIEGRDINEFMKRISVKVESDKNFGAVDSTLRIGRLVDYVSIKDHLPNMTPFNKFDNYSWQREYRIVLGREIGEGPLIDFNIGDISNIVTVTSTEKLINIQHTS